MFFAFLDELDHSTHFKNCLEIDQCQCTFQVEQVTVMVEVEAPPGLVLVVEQATGSCDDSQVRTEQFRTSHHDRQGNIRHQSVVFF